MTRSMKLGWREDFVTLLGSRDLPSGAPSKLINYLKFPVVSAFEVIFFKYFNFFKCLNHTPSHARCDTHSCPTLIFNFSNLFHKNCFCNFGLVLLL